LPTKKIEMREVEKLNFVEVHIQVE
jgi:hypothetical protein